MSLKPFALAHARGLHLALIARHLMLIRLLRASLLQLQQQTRVLYFDQIINVLQPCLHKSQLRFSWVVPERNRLAHDIFIGCHEVCWQKFNKLVLYVLDEVELSWSVAVHNEDCQERMRLFYTRVDHFDQDVCVFGELDHKLLLFLHVAVGIEGNFVRVVEKEIVFWGELDADVLNLVLALTALEMKFEFWICLQVKESLRGLPPVIRLLVVLA